MSQPQTASSFQPIEKKRLSETIVEQLRARILAGELQPGERLPSERELSKTLGVTRVSLREALRALEQEDLIETRHGEGSVVKDYVQFAGLGVLQHLLRLGNPDAELMRSALEFRAMIGMDMARMAALRRSDNDLRMLEELVASEREFASDSAAVQKSDFTFFTLLADASRNILMKFLMNTVREPYLSQADLFGLLIGDPKEVVTYHERILEAVRAGDSAGAADLAASYLKAGMTRILGEGDSQ